MSAAFEPRGGEVTREGEITRPGPDSDEQPTARRTVYTALVAAGMPPLDAADLVNRFQDEVAREHSLTPPKRKRCDHVKAAKRLRTIPRQWRMVGLFTSLESASDIAYQVQVARIRAYGPAGSYEAKVHPVSAGVRLYVRYVGDPEGGGPRDQ